MTDERDERPPTEDVTAAALRLVVRDDAETAVPRHIEDAVMRAWDARGAAAARPRQVRRPAWAVFAAACAILVAALWLARDRGAAPAVVQTTPVATSPTGESAAASLASIAPIDVLLQEDPASLQLVRLSVQPSVLVALGDPLADPTATQPLDVEVLVGLDGVPRAVRRVDNLLNRE
jgi:hypothetical protein